MKEEEIKVKSLEEGKLEECKWKQSERDYNEEELELYGTTLLPLRQ